MTTSLRVCAIVSTIKTHVLTQQPCIVLSRDTGDSGKLEGLLGNFNGDPNDDFTDWMGKQHSVSTMTDDQLYSYQDSCMWCSSKHLKKKTKQKKN